MTTAAKTAEEALGYFYLANYATNKWAHRDSVGEHDGLVCDSMDAAACFETFAEASEYSQNFGPDWTVYSLAS